MGILTQLSQKRRSDVKRFRSGYKDERTGKFIKGYTTLNATSENSNGAHVQGGRAL